MVEVWRAIPSLGGRYQASNFGNIRHRDSRRVRKLRTQSNGYLAVNVINADGKHSTLLVHRLVAEAFLGEPPPGFTVDHINGDKTANTPENLQWVTQAVNSQRKRAVRAASGVMNVEFRSDRPTLPWLVRVKRCGTTVNVGSYATVPEAVAARDAFKRSYDSVG